MLLLDLPKIVALPSTLLILDLQINNSLSCIHQRWSPFSIIRLFLDMLGDGAHLFIAKAFLSHPHSLLAFTISHLLCYLGYCPYFFGPTQYRLSIFPSRDFSQHFILTITPHCLHLIFLFFGILPTTLFTYTLPQCPSFIYSQSNLSCICIFSLDCLLNQTCPLSWQTSSHKAIAKSLIYQFTPTPTILNQPIHALDKFLCLKSCI